MDYARRRPPHGLPVPGLVPVQGRQGLPRWKLRRAGRVARDCFTGQAIEREVTVGDTLDTLTLDGLRATVRAFIGPPGEALEHTCDVIVEEVCRQWPEKTMADYAAKLDAVGDKVLDAIAVITARVREQIEARWGVKPSHTAALDLVLRGCVIEFCNLWFASAENRIAMRAIIAVVRHARRT
jgi:hypothetical protein